LSLHFDAKPRFPSEGSIKLFVKGTEEPIFTFNAIPKDPILISGESVLLTYFLPSHFQATKEYQDCKWKCSIQAHIVDATQQHTSWIIDLHQSISLLSGKVCKVLL
jgi:hypothetical protein